MKAQSLEALPLVAVVLSFCGVGVKTGSASEGFAVSFHLSHQPASVNIHFRATVLRSETFWGAEENSAGVPFWQKSVIWSCEGSK